MLNILLDSLQARLSSPTVSNQYQNKKILNNLKLFLMYLSENRHNVLLLGEAPGYKGGRITGIPFTSGAVIRQARHRAFQAIGDKLCFETIEAEATASVFWEFFGDSIPVPILWNAFPFHPHIPHKPQTNRKPSRLEIEEGKKYLEILVEIFRPKELYAVGRTAQRLISALLPGHEVRYIRHPARGGKQAFFRGIKEIY